MGVNHGRIPVVNQAAQAVFRACHLRVNAAVAFHAGDRAATLPPTHSEPSKMTATILPRPGVPLSRLIITH